MIKLLYELTKAKIKSMRASELDDISRQLASVEKMGFTYIDILSYTGPLQSYFRESNQFLANFLNQDYLQIEVLGIILGLALYPYIYTASRISFSLIGSNYINVSKTLGLTQLQTFFKVILPLSRPAIFSGLFLVIMEVLNEYGAVKYFGVNTFTTGIFRSWLSFGDVNGAIQLACILLFVVLCFFAIDRISIKKSKFYYQKNTQTSKIKYLGGEDPVTYYCLEIKDREGNNTGRLNYITSENVVKDIAKIVGCRSRGKPYLKNSFMFN